VETLNPGPPDYNTSALNHSATLPRYHHHQFAAIIKLLLPMLLGEKLPSDNRFEDLDDSATKSAITVVQADD